MSIKNLLFSIVTLLSCRIAGTSQSVSPFEFNKEGLEKVSKQLASATLSSLATQPKAASDAQSLITSALEKSLATINVAEALKNADTEHVGALTNQMKRIFTTAITELLYTHPQQLSWCECPNAPGDMRVALIMQVVNDTRKTRNPHKRLVYTSLASGALLTDYLIISELIDYGFNNLQVNFIDLGLLDIPELDAAIKQSEQASQEMEQSTSESITEQARLFYNQQHTASLRDDALHSIGHLHAFKHKIETLSKPASLTLNHYYYVHNYLARAKKYPFERTDILVLVDPSVALYPLKDSVGSQVFAIQDGKPPKFNTRKETLVTFMPLTSVYDIKLYSNIHWDRLSKEDPLHTWYAKISTVIQEAQDLAKERQHLTRAFDYISFIKRRVQEEIPQGKERSATIYWISEAYLSLQDIIREGLSNVKKAAIYELAYPTRRNPKPRIQKLNAREYQTKDVITPYIGAALMDEGYKDITGASPTT